MRVSIDNTTGLMIEAQSNPRDGTLTENALAAGFTDVSERDCTEQELADLIVAKDAATVASLPLDQLILVFEVAVQSYLDQSAQSCGYDNITTACSYAGAANPFQTEAQSFVTWRGNVWAYCYQALDDVKTGTRPMPTIEQIISELPVRE